MIQLHPDYLLFQTTNGETIACSAESVTLELIGEAASLVDPEMIRHAATAVLHYFKNELQREVVSVTEFSAALKKVLAGLGFEVRSETDENNTNVIVSDLRAVASNCPAGLELAFFRNLRAEFQRRLREEPEVLRFDGLRPCVKNLVGAKRWNPRCQELSDQIVRYLRKCLISEQGPSSCDLIIR